MIPEKISMELKARILIVISISSLILYLSVEGIHILPSIAQPNFKLGKVNQLEKDRGPSVLAKSNGPFKPLLGRLIPTPAPSPVQDEAQKMISPVPSPNMNKGKSVLGPVSPSNLGPSSPYSSPVPGPVNYEDSPSSSPGPTPTQASASAPTPFFDHDVALAIEARIKQSQSDSQLAMDEAKKLLKDPNIASSETGKCLSKCLDKYGASLDELNRAITDLGVRDVTMLSDDFGAVESDISACQACFTENIGEDSPLKALEEATSKAARECLTVMDYAA
ncbi:Pectinesterase inhibitor [Artemisia annua]|uniref:Pectinesterase inhibitor n=1 Tax=Artemisia annua TaxID=35608 RepID=A0A2U1KQ46_ARTAN|nr:Pectinesterase inhibitor [Artemisia annua]